MSRVQKDPAYVPNFAEYCPTYRRVVARSVRVPRTGHQGPCHIIAAADPERICFTNMALSAGTRLGPYEIQSALGAGGMGEVYRARDTRLDRIVAIKVLPEDLVADHQLRERFEREARTLSQIDHPHICALHDVGDHEGTPFLVMQYLDGETLADRLAHGEPKGRPPDFALGASSGKEGRPLHLDHALAIAIQIADALTTAHRAGIVHRDLKPGNIFLVRRGGPSRLREASAGQAGPPDAKLLDFGLARTNAPVVTGTGLSMLPTTPVNLTTQGTILGTLQYMAPEQLEGKEADARSDIFPSAQSSTRCSPGGRRLRARVTRA